MEIEGYFRFLLALIFVLALIGVFAALARRLGFGFPTASRKGKGRRLSVSEVMNVDTKRRLLLVRRDDVEHLVLVGGGSDTVVEVGIRPPAFAAALEEAVHDGPAASGAGDKA